MLFALTDTIVALASPPGAAERGIIRISGDAVADVVEQLFTANDEQNSWREQRRATRIEGQLNLPSVGIPVPTALMFWPTTRSYTGQPMAELHTMGSLPLLDAVIERLLECGARHANRGEFTMRAFLAGRIDLVQAEAVLGIIDATDHDELQTALTQFGGGITSMLSMVRGEILSLLGDLEAGLDFVEEDIEFISKQQICDRLDASHQRLIQLAEDSDERLASGYRRRVVLAGLPNAGKSTLFNRILGSEKAIVSEIAGTTRDYLTGVTTFGDLEIELIDTAGWEDAADLIMQHAQQFRSEQVRGSDLILWCTPNDLSPAEAEENECLRRQLEESNLATLDVRTRCDLELSATSLMHDLRAADVRVSAKTGDGIEALIKSVTSALSADRRSRAELVSSTAARCRDSLRQSMLAIQSAQQAAENQLGDEIIAMELRDALHQIATILGEVYTDDILDHIFSNFCIGK